MEFKNIFSPPDRMNTLLCALKLLTGMFHVQFNQSVVIANPFHLNKSRVFLIVLYLSDEHPLY